MKKIILTSALIILTIALSGLSHAKVTGACYNCHTMHNSQGGAAMARQLNAERTGFESDTTPNPSLLISDCAGCHSASGSATWSDSTTGAPIVFNTNTPATPLAGGNFYYLTDVTKGDRYGHNVSGLANAETAFSTIPGSATAYYQIRCAGEYGCHGNRTAGNDELAGIKGAHHTDDTGGITGASVGLSYRFLNAILGKEDSDWEHDNIVSSHNEYKGSTTSATDTISYLCAMCHGKFHTWQGGATEVGTASPWFRHPTDIALKGSGEYANYTAYSLVAPVARPNPNSVADTTAVTPGTDIVMCLSCHRAHGSPYYKMIRWDYKSTTLSTALSGCNVCHTSKN